MVSIIFCGPTGVGKKELIRDVLRKCSSHVQVVDIANGVLHRYGISHCEVFRCDEKTFVEIQSVIIADQCNAELATRSTNVITDHCIFFSLALLQLHVGHQALENEFQKVCVQECIDRYRRSLVVLIWPPECSYDRRLNVLLPADQWDSLRHTIIALCHRFHVPFLEIKSTDVSERVKLIKEALNGLTPLETSNLSTYKKVKDGEDSRPVQTNFLFSINKSKKEDCIHIPTIAVTEHFYKQDWTMYDKGETNRFILKETHDRLACLEFDMTVKASVVQKMLLGGVYINGDLFSFLACSSSGLKTRKCFIMKGTPVDVNEVLEKHGKFTAIQSVSKRLARESLLFSGVRPTTIQIDRKHVIEKEDIKHMIASEVYNFTDGCGGIGEKLAKDLTAELGDKKIPEDYVPSVFQIRFQGYKGVLAVEKGLPEDAVAVRPSMKKFETTAHPFIGVCDFAKPYTFGHLNKQFIILLSGLGISDEVFKNKQKSYLETVRTMLKHSESAVRILQWKNMFDVAHLINRADSIETLPDDTRKSVKTTLEHLQKGIVSKIQKLKILIPESRSIFGVCDQSGRLQYGQCFLRVTLSGKPTTMKGQVVVCKNPCYLLGDVRVLTAVDETVDPTLRSLNHLVDCIVFPTKGKRPHPNEIAGSDLDGDQFFVSWDRDLIPKSTREPYLYPGTETKPEGTVTLEKVIRYFALQNETQKKVAMVNKFFLQWAGEEGPKSPKCTELGQLFSKVIDASKTGETIEIRNELRPAATVGLDLDISGKFIWSEMVRVARQFEEKFIKKLLDLGTEANVSEEFVVDLAQKTYSTISEYEKFVFIWDHICRSASPIQEALENFTDRYSQFINFSLFSVEEQKRAIELGIPRKNVLNALNSSDIVTEEELSYFLMDTPENSWKRYVTLAHDTFDWAYLLKALTSNEHTLLVFQLPDGVILELQILEKLRKGKEQPVTSGTITGVFYSRHFGYKLKYVLGKEYVSDLTDDTFQVYRDKKKNLTFVWVNASDRKKIKGDKWDKRMGEETNNAISVDLQRFDRRIYSPDKRKHPLVNKLPFVKLEVFVQNPIGVIPYWDIFDANDLLPVSDEAEEEGQIVEEFTVDFDKLFHKDELDVAEVITEEELLLALAQVAKRGNPYAYKSILWKWSRGALPVNITITFVELLQSIITQIAPLPLPDEHQTVIIEIVSMLQDSFAHPGLLLQIISCFCRLGVRDVISQLLLKSFDQLTEEEYLDILEKWEYFVALDTRFSISYIDQLHLSWKMVRESQADLTDLKTRQRDYVHRIGVLHVMSLVQDIHENKEIYKHAMSDAGKTKVATESSASVKYLKVDAISQETPATATFCRTRPLQQSAIRFKGQFVTLTLQQHDTADELLNFCCTGQVQSLTVAPCSVTISLDEGMPEVLLQTCETKKIRYWRIDLIGNIVTYQRVVNGLKTVLNATDVSQILQKVVQGTDPGSSMEMHVLQTDESTSSDSERLNSSQQRAVQCALTNNITLIQGPPGTGKTEVACHIIRSVINAKMYKGILAVAETNVAVDNLTRRLKNDVVVVRIGPVEGVDRDLYDVSLEGQVKIIAAKEAKRSNFCDVKGNIHTNIRLIKRVLSAADVILTTCAGAGDRRLENIEFPFVLVDEATQTLETTVLCCLTHEVKHLVMIGDPKQLGPIAKTFPQEYKSQNLPDLELLSETLFHKWYNDRSTSCCFLDTQYRMHPAIMKFPSNEFYDGMLTASPTLKSLPIIFPWPDRNQPVCFIDVDGVEKRRGTSFYNTEEVDVVTKVVDVLLCVDEEAYRENRIAMHQIGVITLYQGQVNKLKESLNCAIKVSSVDGFQGQEKDVIIVSTVRSNDRRSLGFSDDAQRINVLLTRAKRGLIVVGNVYTLQGSTIWSRWLKDAPKLKFEDLIPVEGSANKDKHKNGKGSSTKKTFVKHKKY